MGWKRNGGSLAYAAPGQVPFRAALGTVILFLCCFAAAALDEGAGSYRFADPETGATVTVWFHKPAAYTPDSPVVMVFHGVNRNAERYRNVWSPLAERHGLMVLVPEFDAVQFPGDAYAQGNYFQGKGRERRVNPRQRWSFRLPERLFVDFTENREATRAASYHLYGHSAGAQFIHRMLLCAPSGRVGTAVIANAGWYTMPDRNEAWPYGLKGTDVSDADVAAFLGKDLVVLLGEADTDQDHPHLRRTAKADRQGVNRVQLGMSFYDYGSDTARARGARFGWRLGTVPGAGHSNAHMAPAAAAIFAARHETARRPGTCGTSSAIP